MLERTNVGRWARIARVCGAWAPALVSLALAGCEAECVTDCVDAGDVDDAGPSEDAGLEGDAGPLECALQRRVPPSGPFSISNVPECPGGFGSARPIPEGATLAAVFGPFERDVRIEQITYVLGARDLIGACQTDIAHHVGVFVSQTPLSTADFSPDFLAWQLVAPAEDKPTDQLMEVTLDTPAVVPAGREAFAVISIPARATDADPTACPLICRAVSECNRDWGAAGYQAPFAWMPYSVQGEPTLVVIDIAGTVP